MGSMSMSPRLPVSADQLPRVRDTPRDGRRRRGQRAGQERAAPGALPPLEVAVAGADRVLTGPQLIAVHGDAHRAAGLAPLGARLKKHTVQPLGLGLLLHALRAGV